jgi:branched-chain amino acid transport system permease protein
MNINNKISIKKDLQITAITLILFFILPLIADPSLISSFSYYLLWTFCGIGLAAMWGHGGILSFGQSAFIGLSGYAYGVLTINWGESPIATWSGLFGSLAVSGFIAAALGYMIFYGRVTGVFIGIITLSVTLVFETFMAQTAGPQWIIGNARLNGYNGMSGMPPLSIKFGGDLIYFEGVRLYYLLIFLVALVYILTIYLLRSNFGLTLSAIRENPKRAEMLGVDIRKYQLIIFIFGGVLSGLSGSMYTIWGSYITPSSMGLNAAALPVIWVAAAGRKSIAAVIVTTFGFGWLSEWLAVYGSEYALILMGGILLFVVMAAPNGIIEWISDKFFTHKFLNLRKRSVNDD